MSETGSFYTSKTQETEQSYRWVFHGNIVIPTGNPFGMSQAEQEALLQEQQQGREGRPSVVWLGPCLKLCRYHILAVDYEGKIVHLSHQDQFDCAFYKGRQNYVRLSRHEFLCPGFIDLHSHAPQFAYTGTATDKPLMGPDGWLETYTFPAERSLKENKAKARQVYEGVVKTTLQAGTTTAVYFGTLDIEPCKVLVDVALNFGQRALVGKVCMDRNSPDDYRQSTEQNYQETKELIEYIRRRVGSERDRMVLPTVLPVVTPRFIPTCSPALLTRLGELAQQYKCHIQSHISESIDEVEFSRMLDQQDHNGKARTDAVVLDSHNLLTNRCIMAHGVHLTDQDLDLIKKRGAAIAHCPLSNFFFAGGNLPCRKLMERGNKVGLGTDVAGGYSPSMMQSARMAVVASNVIKNNNKNNTQQSNGKNGESSNKDPLLDYRQAFYLATLGGAEALGLSHRIGTFDKGMEFDAFILSASVRSPVTIFDTDTVPDIFQKLCNLGDDRNVKRVFVQGREVMKNGMILYEI